MNLDDRLHLAREEYRALPSPALPTSLTPTTGGSRRTLLLAAAAVVVIGGLAALALFLADRDDTSSLDVVGPDPSTTSTEEPMPFIVPDLIGLEVSRAREAVTAAGIEVAVNERDGDLPDAVVIAQEPGAGTEIIAGGPAGSAVVGVRTALPPPPESVDCPSMSQLRAITPDQTVYLPRADAVALGNVRSLVDQLDTKLVSQVGLSSAWGDAMGVYVGEGIVPTYEESGPDGEPTTLPPRYHIVIEVPAGGACPQLVGWNGGIPIWGTVGWPSSAETEDADPDPEHQSEGAVAESDPAITLDPAGPYVDGQEITVITPEGYREDWVNDVPRLCAIVADDPAGPIETCDPLGVIATEAPSETEVRVALSQRIFTPTGYRTCDEPAITCRLVVWNAEDRWRASGVLRFEGSPTPHSFELGVSPGPESGTIVLEPEGLAPHPSWLEARSGFTEGSEIGAFWIEICAFGASQADLAPYGEPLWTFSARADDLPDANCESPPGALIDPDDPDSPVVVDLSGRLHGYSGRSDCRIDRCFIVVSQTILDNDSEEPGLAGYSQRVTAALLPFDPDAALPPPPSISIVDDGPHRAGTTITVEISGLPEGRDTNIGVCRVEQPWGCGYPLDTFGVRNGTHELVLPETVATCAPEQCYLELDSQGEGLPPFATAPLPIAQE